MRFFLRRAKSETIVYNSTDPVRLRKSRISYRHERSSIMKKTYLILVAAVVVLSTALLTGCAKTKVIDSWRDEAYTGRPARILVLAVAKEVGPRTLMEDEFGRQLKAHGVEPFKGTALFPEEGLPTRDAVITKAMELNADAVMVVRFLKKTTGETSTPIRRYATPAGFDTSWDTYYGSPTSMTEVGIRDMSYDFYYAVLETTMFDLKTRNPLWSIYTNTKYEDHPLKQIGPFTSTIMSEMDKAKLLPRH
jgi:hypothetical protein